MGVSQTDGETAPCHLGSEIENPKGFHAVRRDCVLIVHDSDVAKPEGLYESLHNFVLRDGGGEFPLVLGSAPMLV